MTNIFQSEQYFEFLNSLGFVEPFKITVEREGTEKGRIIGYIQKDGGSLKSYLSRRAIINGGPALAEDINASEIAELLLKCKQYLRGKSIYVESRNYSDYSKYKQIFIDNGFEYQAHYNFHIDTSNMEVAESRLHQNPKRSIKSSLKNGAVVIENPTESQVREFYDILRDLYATRVHTPLFPWEFFDKASKCDFIKPILVQYDNHIVGGGLYVIGDSVLYEWFICGQDGKYKGVSPSTLGTYAGIKYAVEHGFSRFDMMGAGAPGDGGYGVRDFKAKFGGDLVEHGRFVCVLNKPLFAIGKLGVKIMKKL